MKWFTQKRRAYAYRVAVAALPLLVALGALSDRLVPLLASLIAAFLVPGLAAAHTPTKPPTD